MNLKKEPTDGNKNTIKASGAQKWLTRPRCQKIASHWGVETQPDEQSCNNFQPQIQIAINNPTHLSTRLTTLFDALYRMQQPTRPILTSSGHARQLLNRQSRMTTSVENVAALLLISCLSICTICLAALKWSHAFMHSENTFVSFEHKQWLWSWCHVWPWEMLGYHRLSGLQMRVTDEREELTANYRCTGWVWEKFAKIFRLQENHRWFWRNFKNIP